MNVAYSIVAITVDYSETFLARTVFAYDEQLEVFEGLVENALYGGREVFLTIKNAHNDADNRMGHQYERLTLAFSFTIRYAVIVRYRGSSNISNQQTVVQRSFRT
jgi:hypothetical protein